MFGVLDLAFFFLMFKSFRREGKKTHLSERLGTPAGRRVGCWEGPPGVPGSDEEQGSHPYLATPSHPYIPLNPKTSS